MGISMDGTVRPARSHVQSVVAMYPHENRNSEPDACSF